MSRYVVYICVWAALILACGPSPEIEEIGEAGNTLHLIPFQCSYLGIPISELDGCSIACPGRVFYDHNLAEFSASLQCEQPSYDFLVCELNR